MPTTYYTYKDPYPAIPNHPYAAQLESTEDWPKTFRYNPNLGQSQGIHPPAPVYTANQPAPQSWYYYGGQQQAQPQTGYYINGQFYPSAPAGMNYQSPSSSYYYYQSATNTYFPATTQATQPTYPCFYITTNPKPEDFFCFPGQNPYSYFSFLATGGPTIIPMPGCAATMTAQAAQAAATNAALAAMPQGPQYFVGNPMDYATQQAIIAAQFAQMGMPKPPPTQLAPYKPADGQQFWCKELDGSWTLRTHTDIVMGEVSPGHWERHATSGYFYWVRALA